MKAVSAGTARANLYVGVKPFLNGSRIAAALKGLLDAGLVIPAGEDIFPDEERLSGGHVAKYAKSLLAKDTGVYRSTFSQLIKAGFKPEDYPKHFEETVNRVKSDFKVKGDE